MHSKILILKMWLFQEHIVLEKVASWLHIRKGIVVYDFCIFRLHISSHQMKKMRQR